MNGWAQELRFALRLLARKPGFTAVALFTLALGIGASTSMFTILHQVVLRPLPYGTPEELVFLNETSVDGNDTYSISIPNFFDWRQRQRSFQSVSAFRADNLNWTGTPEPQPVRVGMVSGDFFATLDVDPLLGAAFEEDDALAVVLSYACWQQDFGGSVDVLGKTMILDNRSFVVRGVMPPEFEFLTTTVELWLPIGTFREDLPWEDRGRHPGLWATARLRPGVTIGQAQDDMRRIASELATEFDHRDGIQVTSLHERAVRRSAPSLFALMGSVGLLLVIACVNVAGLVLSRASGRSREIATRAALGAGMARLMRQLMTESLILSLAGGALGLILAGWGTDLLQTLLPDNTPRLTGLATGGSAFLFGLAVSACAGLAFGLAPLRQVRASLRSRLSTSSKPTRLRGALVVAQVALAVVLLVSSGLLVKTFLFVSTTDMGFDPVGRVAARIALPASRYSSAEESIRFYRELLRTVETLPDVDMAAVSTGLPLVDPGHEVGVYREGVVPSDESIRLASVQAVSRDYFRTLGIPLVSGRVFDETERPESLRVAVVGEMFAERLFPGESALGKRVFFDESEGVTIVGVVRHVLNYQLARRQYVELYVPLEQPSLWMGGVVPPAHLVLRGRGPEETLVSAIRASVARLDPQQPVFGATTLEAVRREAVGTERANSILAAAFALSALGLAALGLYGVLATLVGLRTGELALRMALGASPHGILRSVLRDGLAMVALGLGLGLLGVVGAVRVLASLVHGVELFDPGVVAASLGAVAIVTVLASVVPSRRALSIRPIEALRGD